MAEFNPGAAADLNEAVKLRYEANADTNAYTDAEKSKLSAIAAGATANDSDAALRDRSTHTGTQAISTVTSLQAALDGKSDTGHGHASATAGADGFISAADKAKLDGVATGANAYVHPNHSGDVTSTGDGATAIAAGAVTNAKLANVATGTIKGRTTAGSGTPEDLTAAQARTVMAVPHLASPNSFTAAQGTTPVTLTDAATIATDASLSNQFVVTLGGNRTLGAPTNLVAGRVYEWEIRQDATGSRTLAYASIFKFEGGTAPVLGTAANSSDIITARYNGTNLHCIKAGSFAP